MTWASRCLGPRIARSSLRSASWKGCVVAPDAKDNRTLSIQGRVRVMIRAPKVAKGEILRKGGLSLPVKVSPPPSFTERERKPNWTIATRSVRRGTLKAGRHSGRSRTWSPSPSFPSCSDGRRYLRPSGAWEMGSLGSLLHEGLRCLPQGGFARAGGASGHSCLRALSPGVMRRDRLPDWVPVFPGALRGVRPPPLKWFLRVSRKL